MEASLQISLSPLLQTTDLVVDQIPICPNNVPTLKTMIYHIKGEALVHKQMVYNILLANTPHNGCHIELLCIKVCKMCLLCISLSIIIYLLHVHVLALVLYMYIYYMYMYMCCMCYACVDELVR